MGRDKYLIITAGGSGTRMGAPVPKQFLQLDGKPVLQMTMEKFIDAEPDIRIVTVLPSASVPMWKDLCYENNFAVRQTIVEGGITRFHSVRNGLEKVPDGALVAIHDGVRPLVSPGFISSVFRLAENVPAVTPVIPCTDTLRQIVRRQDGTLERVDDPYVDRSRVYAVQTPQIFWSEVIKDAYRQAYDTVFTDDASVAEKKGVEVCYVDGEKSNIKLTAPDDMKLVEALCSILHY